MSTTINVNNETYLSLKKNLANYQNAAKDVQKKGNFRKNHSVLRKIKQVPAAIIDFLVETPEVFFDRTKISRNDMELIRLYAAAADKVVHDRLLKNYTPEQYQWILLSTASSWDLVFDTKDHPLKLALKTDERGQCAPHLSEAAKTFQSNAALSKQLLVNFDKLGISKEQMIDWIINAPEKSELKTQAKELVTLKPIVNQPKQEPKGFWAMLKAAFAELFRKKTDNIEPSVIESPLWVNQFNENENNLKEEAKKLLEKNESTIESLKESFKILGIEFDRLNINESQRQELALSNEKLKNQSIKFAGATQYLNDHKKLEERVTNLVSAFEKDAEKQQRSNEKTLDEKLQQLGKFELKNLTLDHEILELNTKIELLRTNVVNIKNNRAEKGDLLPKFNKKLKKHQQDCKEKVETAEQLIEECEKKVQSLQQAENKNQQLEKENKELQEQIEEAKEQNETLEKKNTQLNEEKIELKQQVEKLISENIVLKKENQETKQQLEVVEKKAKRWKHEIEIGLLESISKPEKEAGFNITGNLTQKNIVFKKPKLDNTNYPNSSNDSLQMLQTTTYPDQSLNGSDVHLEDTHYQENSGEDPEQLDNTGYQDESENASQLLEETNFHDSSDVSVDSPNLEETWLPNKSVNSSDSQEIKSQDSVLNNNITGGIELSVNGSKSNSTESTNLFNNSSSSSYKNMGNFLFSNTSLEIPKKKLKSSKEENNENCSPNTKIKSSQKENFSKSRVNSNFLKEKKDSTLNSTLTSSKVFAPITNFDSNFKNHSN